ncbi:sulfatase-like hydrolase/transferase [Hydrogenophaga sp. 5NK40-0174]|uniref:sulfatase-like hydrolase/transferase n=1 Tax=Hydrogenophaga sp. 5NK40-0174 TaxID=3127649 RepID=UPI00310A0265
MTVLLASLVVMVIALALLLRRRRSRLVAAFVSLAWVVWSVAAVLHLISDHFTGQGFDEAVVFHLRVGLAGTGWREYWLPVASAALMSLLILLVAWSVFRRMRSQSDNVHSSLASQWWGLGLLAAALGANPAALAGGRMVLASVSAQGEPAPSVFQAQAGFTDGRAVKPQRNLVYIYLESVERTYLDDRLFPGLAPNLSRLEKLGASHTDVRQVHGTGWTIAGMVASQCGLPLVLPGDSSVATTLDQFLPEARCMGDVLKDAGYELHYMGGADAGFAGKGNFYRTHGFSHVHGLHELQGRLPAERARSAWGIYDDDLFGLVEAEYHRLAKADKPFGIFTLTLDTHHPVGHETPSCKDLKYRDGQNAMLNAVACADRMVGRLMDRLLESEAAKDTVFVIASDHLAMNNAAIDQLRQGDRKNLFLVIDGGDLRESRVSRSGSMLDAGASVMARLVAQGGPGVTFRLGYGHSMEGEASTLTEELEADTDAFLSRHDRFHASLWDRPQLDEGIRLLPGEQGLALGDRSVRLPVLMMVDADATLLALRSADSAQWNLQDQVLASPPGRHFVWVDDCEQTWILEPEQSPRGRVCLAAGRMGDTRIHLQTLDEGVSVAPSALRAHLSSASPDLVAYALRQSAADKWKQFGTDQVFATAWPEGGGRRASTLLVRSSARGAGKSMLMSPDTAWRQVLKPGVHVVELDAHGAPVRQLLLSDCLEHKGGAEAAVEMLEQATSGQGSTLHLLVGAEADACAPDLIRGSLEQTPLQHWEGLAEGQPYAVFFDGKGGYREYYGPPGSAVAVEIESAGARSSAPAR